MEKEELLELIKGMREDDRKRLADSSIPAAGEERFVPVFFPVLFLVSVPPP